MKEYEYSFKVESIKPYVEYCEKNGYEKISVTTQNRVVYENKHSEHIIARVTTTEIDGKKETVFDCKNVGETHKSLKISNETIPMVVTDENKEIVKSILEVLDFYEAANNIRTRYEYVSGGVKFEIDDYIRPQAQVVAIEGEKELVDKVYEQVKNLK